MKILVRFKQLLLSIPNKPIIIAIVSFFWLLYRTGTKPSRINYPCQQAAMVNSGILIYLVPAFHINRLVQKKSPICKNSRAGRLFVICLGLMVIVYSSYSVMESFGNRIAWKRLFEVPRGPSGIPVADGFQTIPSAGMLDSPHRVVSVHNTEASSWIGSGNPHETMNQEAIDAMVESGVMALTGKATASEAWRQLIPYQAGETVVVKLNFNNMQELDWEADPFMNPYAELIKSIITNLNSIGVPSSHIILTDPSRIVPDQFRFRIGDTDVKYYVNPGVNIGGRSNVYATSFVTEDSGVTSLSEGTNITIRPAQVFVDAAHIINVPQLKGHGGASITLGLKNHFGSIFIDNAMGESPLHSYFYIGGSSYGGVTHNYLADINNNSVFRNKTRLIIGDGLMGHSTINYRDPHTWDSFGGQPPETLFFGVDPVAIDCVMTDFLEYENLQKNEAPRNDEVLQYASAIGLGVYERWDHPTTRQYSVIDYIPIDLNQVPLSPTSLTMEACAHDWVKLSWIDNSYSESGFLLQRSLSPMFGTITEVMLGVDVESYTDTGVIPSQKYYYRIRAYNAEGDSGWSNIVTVEIPQPMETVVHHGSKVNIVVKANNCDGKTVYLEYFSIKANDRFKLQEGAYGLPISGEFQNGVLSIPWTVVRFTEDHESDPGLEFVARCEDSEYKSQIIIISK